MDTNLFEAREKRNKFYQIIRTIASTECHKQFADVSEYIEKTYGISITIDGYITANYRIVNEQKYMLFRIKFGI